MNMNEQMKESEESILHTYNRFPVVFEKGQGCYLYDSEGKEYLDFAAGISVNSLGYHYPGYDEALKEQIDKLMHISNLYYNEPIIEAGAKLVKASKMSKAFFTNSGTEAIEGALKAAKKYAYVRDGHADHEIIAMNHSFHGRSLGALAVTGNAHYQEPFEPLMPGVKFADFNDFESVESGWESVRLFHTILYCYVIYLSADGCGNCTWNVYSYRRETANVYACEYSELYFECDS